MDDRLRRLLPSVPPGLINRAGSAYLAGPALADAVERARRLTGRGDAVGIAYWHGDGDTAVVVAAEIRAAIEALSGLDARTAVAVKAPGLDFDGGLLRDIARAAASTGVALTFDAHSPADADGTLQAAASAREVGATVGVALPARWRRSTEDARWAMAQGLGIRLIKGQWADVGDRLSVTPESVLRRSYLALVDEVAGGSSRISVATHDGTLLDAAVTRLRAAGTSCDVELLVGFPHRRCLAVARQHRVDVRWYVAYGHPSLAYPLPSVLCRPRLARSLIQGVALGRLNQLLRMRDLAGGPERSA